MADVLRTNGYIADRPSPARGLIERSLLSYLVPYEDRPDTPEGSRVTALEWRHFWEAVVVGGVGAEPNPEVACWFWLLGTDHLGRARHTRSRDGKAMNQAAATTAYEWLVGPLPRGPGGRRVHTAMTCGNLLCVATHHLELRRGTRLNGPQASALRAQKLAEGWRRLIAAGVAAPAPLDVYPHTETPPRERPRPTELERIVPLPFVEAPSPRAAPPPPVVPTLAPGSPEACEHPNECPRVCPCEPGCYCRSRQCQPETGGFDLGPGEL